MPRVKSAKGKVIDFDLLKIKRQIAGKPISIDVKARQNFIDEKVRRKLRKIKQATAAGIKIDDPVLTAVEPTEVSPLIEKQEKQVIDLTKTTEDKIVKQKIRPPKEV